MALAAVVASCASFPGSPSHADETALENIEVTGTRIPRRDFETASPVVSLSSVPFETTSAISLEPTLNRMPQFVPTVGAASVSPGNDGQSNVSLRGVGVRQTLVLLDGRRLVPADGSGSPDLNNIPPALIESVEVMTGGASTVYGSDAIAGVVNIKLEHEFQGVALDGRWSQTERGDGETYDVGLTAGTTFAAGRGSIVSYAGYSRREQLLQIDRDFSRYPLAYYPDVTNGHGPGGHFLGGGTSLTEYGIYPVFPSDEEFRQVFAGYGYPAGTVDNQQGFALNDDGTVFTIGNGNPDSVANFRGEFEPGMQSDRQFTVNEADHMALQLPLERVSVYLRGSYEFGPAAQAFVQVLYADYTTTTRLGPVGAQILLVPPTNPYIPADLARLRASTTFEAKENPFRLLRLMPELGPQEAENDRSLLQATAGIDGRLSDNWHYAAYVQVGRNERSERQTNNVDIAKFEELTFAPDGGQAICGLMNPFGRGHISAECARYFAADVGNDATFDERIAEVSINGPLLALPAGSLTLAAGALYKRDEFRFDADPVAEELLPEVPDVVGPRPPISGFPTGPDRGGDVRNTDVYLEALVPLVRGMRGIQDLTLGLGYRLSDYSQSGLVDSYKGELSFTPAEPIRVRGSYQHAVRAPSVEELYYPQLPTIFAFFSGDPCDHTSAQRTGPDQAAVEALCLAQGMPEARLDAFTYKKHRVEGFSGGNPELDAETADTYTAGVVFTSPFEHPALRQLRVSLDWYRIEFENAIGLRDADSVVSRCFDPALNPGYDPAYLDCGYFHRDAITGEIVAVLVNTNIGGLETSGIDAQIDWSYETRWGALGVNQFVTYVDQWHTHEPDGEYAGTISNLAMGRSIPRWKGLLNLSFDTGALTLHGRWQYVDGMRDAVFRDFEVPARNYFDLGASYELQGTSFSGLTLGLGVENLSDEQPPIFPSWQQANTDPSQYDVLGRRYYVDLRYRF
jgi:outer membrane receptor protein involved in Fe transport